MEDDLVEDDSIEDEVFLFDEYHGNTCKGKEEAKDTVDSTSYNYTSNDLTEPVYDATETCEAIQASLESLIGAAYGKTSSHCVGRVTIMGISSLRSSDLY